MIHTTVVVLKSLLNAGASYTNKIKPTQLEYLN